MAKDPTFQPGVYRTSGGDQITISSGGVLKFESGGTLTLTGQTITTTGAVSGSSGDFTAGVDITSGMNASTGDFSGSLSVGGNVTITSGLNATTGSFTGNVTGVNLTLTSGVNATTGSFTGNITGVNLTLTSGINGTTGQFSGAFTVAGLLSPESGLTATGGYVYAQAGHRENLEAGTSSGGALVGYGISSVKSTANNQVVYTIEPVAGLTKYIYCIVASGTTSAPIVTTTGTWDGTNNNALFTTGNSNQQSLIAVGVTTDRWIVLNNTTDVTFSNT